MISNVVTTLLQYFDLFGFCTEYEVALNKMRNKNQTFIIFGVHVLILFIICIMLYNQFVFRRPIVGDDAIFGVNDFIKLASATLVYFAIIVESVYKRPSQRKIWIIYKLSDNNPIPIKHLLLKCLFCVVVCFSAVLRTLHTFMGLPLVQLPLWFCYTTLNLMFGTRIIYYVFYSEFLFGELKSISKLIRKFKIYSESNETKININRSSCDTLKLIRSRYELFRTIINNLNDVFGISHFITIMYCFLVLCSEFNYLYWCFSNNISMHWPSIKIQHKFISNFIERTYFSGIHSDWIAWLFERVTVTSLIFRGTSNCSKMVTKIFIDLNSLSHSLILIASVRWKILYWT